MDVLINPTDVFKPVPAVPAITSTGSDATVVNVVGLPYRGIIDDEDDRLINENRTATTERRRFKKCHGQCVQKVCLPVGALSVYEKCLEKCRGICNG